VWKISAWRGWKSRFQPSSASLSVCSCKLKDVKVWTSQSRFLMLPLALSVALY
jgi:hypothetical protein